MAGIVISILRVKTQRHSGQAHGPGQQPARALVHNGCRPGPHTQEDRQQATSHGHLSPVCSLQSQTLLWTPGRPPLPQPRPTHLVWNRERPLAWDQVASTGWHAGDVPGGAELVRGHAAVGVLFILDFHPGRTSWFLSRRLKNCKSKYENYLVFHNVETHEGFN